MINKHFIWEFLFLEHTKILFQKVNQEYTTIILAWYRAPKIFYVMFLPFWLWLLTIDVETFCCLFCKIYPQECCFLLHEIGFSDMAIEIGLVYNVRFQFITKCGKSCVIYLNSYFCKQCWQLGVSKIVYNNMFIIFQKLVY